MTGGIFISYRRDDAKHAAGRLVDRLGQTFSRDQLFLDIDNIEPGLDFVKVLSQQVQACDVLLAVIGPGWLDNRDKNGTRRLDNPKDFVRIEIEAALARDIRVIPVLVDGAQMPGEGDLPASLHPLLVRNAVRLVHERFASDAEDLTRALAKVVVPRKGGWFAGGSARAPRPVAVRQSHPDLAAALPVAEGLSGETSDTSKWSPLLVAVAFAFLSIAGFVGFVVPFGILDYLNDSEGIRRIVIFTVLLVVAASGLKLMHRRGKALSGTEAAIYGIVVVLSVLEGLAVLIVR